MPINSLDAAAELLGVPTADAALEAVEASGRALHGGSYTSCARCCRPLWGRLHLRLEETRLQIDEERLQLTPAFEVSAASVDELVDPSWCWPWPQPAPPGPAVRLKSPEHEWLLCATSEQERDAWQSALQDAVALSHGPGTPHFDWSMGPALGAGSFGAVRAATHRREKRRAAVKVVAGSHGEATRAAVQREIALMRRLRRELPPGAAVLQLLEAYDCRGDLTLVVAPLCNGDLLQLAEEHGAMSEAQAAGVLRATLRTLALLHALGIVHLDVKPQNLLFRHPAEAQPAHRIDVRDATGRSVQAGLAIRAHVHVHVH